jgi:hypothetical protein
LLEHFLESGPASRRDEPLRALTTVTRIGSPARNNVVQLLSRSEKATVIITARILFATPSEGNVTADARELAELIMDAAFFSKRAMKSVPLLVEFKVVSADEARVLANQVEFSGSKWMRGVAAELRRNVDLAEQKGMARLVRAANGPKLSLKAVPVGSQAKPKDVKPPTGKPRKPGR